MKGIREKKIKFFSSKVFGIFFFFSFSLVLPNFSKAEEIEKISPLEASNLDCEKVSLIHLLKYPKPFLGQKVCFLAYVYYDPENYRSLVLLPAPAKNFDEKYERNASPNKGFKFWEKVKGLPIGYPIYLKVNLTDSSKFWEIPEDEELVPFKEMLTFDVIKVYIFE